MLPIFVINLDRAPDRLARIGAQLGALALDWTRVPALDRRAVPEAELAARFGRSSLARAFPATPGDRACTLTHRALWARVAEGGTPALILEDDATLGEGFADFARPGTAALMKRHGMGVLKIEFWPGPQQSRRLPLGRLLGEGPAGTRLFRLESGFLGSCAYLLTAEAAALLLKRFPTPEVPVDHLLFGRSAARGFPLLRPGFVNPAPVLHDLDRFASDIGGERPADPGTPTLRRRLHDVRARAAAAAARRFAGAAPVRMEFSGAAPQPSVPPER